MKKNRIALIAVVACVGALGITTAAASNYNRAERKEKLETLRSEKEKLEKKDETSVQRAVASSDNLGDERRKKELVCEIGQLEQELGEYDYIADLESSLNTIEAVVFDNKREMQEGDINNYYSEQEIEKLALFNDALLELAAKYRQIIENKEYDSPKELYDQFHKEDDEVKEKYAWQD